MQHWAYTTQVEDKQINKIKYNTKTKRMGNTDPIKNCE